MGSEELIAKALEFVSNLTTSESICDALQASGAVVAISSMLNNTNESIMENGIKILGNYFFIISWLLSVTNIINLYYHPIMLR